MAKFKEPEGEGEEDDETFVIRMEHNKSFGHLHYQEDDVLDQSDRYTEYSNN